MRAWLLALVLFNLLSLGAPAYAETNKAHDNDIRVQEAQFGIINQEGTIFTPTDRVPYRIKQAFGWRLKLANTDKSVHWKEELTLPRPPKTWGEGDVLVKREILNHGTLCISERDEQLSEGWLSNIWEVAAGDPSGDYEVRISVNGKPMHTFKFSVESSIPPVLQAPPLI